MKKIIIIAGETSGDLYGERLMSAMQRQNPELEFYGMGGEKMQAAGLQMWGNFADFAVMGFWEVLKHLPFFAGKLKEFAEKARQIQPDLVILIDYPGFNLQFANRLKRQSPNIPILYYISPQVWAWKERRKFKIAKLADHIAVIFPFEEPIYREIGGAVSYVGHPLLDVLPPAEAIPAPDIERPLIGLLPGSRAKEIQALLPVYLEAVERLKQNHNLSFQVGLARVSHIPVSMYEQIVKRSSFSQSIHFFDSSNRYQLMAHADVLLAASGTATLESGLLGAPLAVCYKVAPLSYWLARRLVKISYISLVNIIFDECVAPEFIQHDFCPEKLEAFLLEMLKNSAAAEQKKKRLKSLRSILGQSGASERVAKIAFQLMK